MNCRILPVQGAAVCAHMGWAFGGLNMGFPRLPKAYNQYGASMGRRNVTTDRDAAMTFRLYRMRLDKGGYDNGGAYWGIGPDSLWHAYTETDEVFVRAKTREDAKGAVRTIYAKAEFYR